MTMETTRIDEKAMADYEAPCATATAEPWNYVPGLAYKHYVESADEGMDFRIGLQSMHPSDGRDVPAEANARFIAASRTVGPLLAAKVRELETENARLRLVDTAAKKWADSESSSATLTLAEMDLLLAIQGLTLDSKLSETQVAGLLADGAPDPEAAAKAVS